VKFDKNVYKWSTHYVNEDGSYRFNPQIVALAALNKVIGGDLLETVHVGEKPVFSGFVYKNLKPVDNLPVLWSYAFRNGPKRSLVLVNLDLKNSKLVRIEHADAGKNAFQRTITADRFTDHNMSEEKVKTIEMKIGILKNGTTLDIPPCSIIAISWE